MEIIYNKLVRDKIPEIIKASGKTVYYETLPERDCLEMLNRKLEEELLEYQADGNIEELADLLEVIYAVAAAKGCALEQLEAIRQAKAEKRGKFDKRIFLKSVIEKQGD